MNKQLKNPKESITLKQAKQYFPINWDNTDETCEAIHEAMVGFAKLQVIKALKKKNTLQDLL